MFGRSNNRRERRYFQSYRRSGVGLLLTLALVAVIGAAYAGTVSLPQTGQTTSYDANTPQRDDGAIRAGVAWPNPRFTDNSDGTVTDNLTGLMWTKDASLPGPRYWQGALDYVASMNSGAGTYGYTDWRLPNIYELESLVNAGQANPATWLISQGFTNMQSDFYWSATTVDCPWTVTDTSEAWGVNMTDGGVYTGVKSGTP
ncbi:MAG: DUF1566 domain-containing protein [Nitrospirae bacterium]|uniref:Lcl C-terminal domain-containing protein n=1 Tax=Candidatus Magnetobacterium casense TaxID=1455061 RepID=UPI0006964E28|nr:DUF1566 domain-containing protein [Candidatus Magnetobacterium casensis]MBF0337469.1 DUF1566 domain-containing protein [Nitrospirota bacterium]